MSYRCINCWLWCYQTDDEAGLREQLQMEPSPTPGKVGVRTPRSVQDDRFLHKKKERWSKCDCCRAEFLSTSAPNGQWADQLEFAGGAVRDRVQSKSPPARGEEHRVGEGDSLWLCVDCIALWIGNPGDAERQAGIKNHQQLVAHNSSLALAWEAGAQLLHDRKDWRPYLLLALVMETEREAHAKTQDLIMARLLKERGSPLS